MDCLDWRTYHYNCLTGRMIIPLYQNVVPHDEPLEVKYRYQDQFGLLNVVDQKRPRSVLWLFDVPEYIPPAGMNIYFCVLLFDINILPFTLFRVAHVDTVLSTNSRPCIFVGIIQGSPILTLAASYLESPWVKSPVRVWPWPHRPAL